MTDAKQTAEITPDAPKTEAPEAVQPPAESSGDSEVQAAAKPATKGGKATKVAQTRKSPRLIKMRREDGKTADVHPDMVAHYRQGGYSEE